jgi:hypothetical protein
MSKRIASAMGQAAHDTLAAIGAAPGIGNRARTQQSKRDKARCPRRQRKQRNWTND